MAGKFGMNMNDTVLLADIGNTHFHIYDGNSIEHLAYDDAIDKYKNQKLFYITVKQQISHEIDKIPLWKNISSQIKIEGEYETMGVDRKALCLSHRDGLFVDAGSAITVDVVEQSVYKGGFILPGLKGYMQTYKNISNVLDTHLDKDVKIEELPTTTKEQISYGIIASIKALIDKHSKGKKLYFTGGDGKFLSAYFEDAIYDEMLVFDGMRKVIKESKIC